MLAPLERASVVVEVMAMKRGPIVVIVIAAAVVVVLAAGVPVQRLLPLLLVLACPLMMLFMHHSGHGKHAAHGDEHTEAQDEALAKKQ
jgi:putative copper export protein